MLETVLEGLQATRKQHFASADSTQHTEAALRPDPVESETSGPCLRNETRSMTVVAMLFR